MSAARSIAALELRRGGGRGRARGSVLVLGGSGGVVGAVGVGAVGVGEIGIAAVDLLRKEGPRLHSRKLRAFDEPPFR